MYGIIKELDEKQKAIATYCHTAKHLKPAEFFSSRKTANNISILEWNKEGSPLLIMRCFDKLQFSNMPVTFSVYEDMAYGGLFAVNNNTLEVSWGKDTIPIYNDSGSTVKGCIFGTAVFGTKNIILMQDMARKKQ